MGGEGRKGWRERRRRGREAKGAESGPRVRPAEWAPRGWWVAGGWRATSCQPQGGRPSVSRWPAPVSVACASVWRRRRPANEQPISRAESPHAPSAPWCDLGRPLALSLSLSLPICLRTSVHLCAATSSHCAIPRASFSFRLVEINHLQLGQVGSAFRAQRCLFSACGAPFGLISVPWSTTCSPLMSCTRPTLWLSWSSTKLDLLLVCVCS